MENKMNKVNMIKKEAVAKKYEVEPVEPCFEHFEYFSLIYKTKHFSFSYDKSDYEWIKIEGNYDPSISVKEGVAYQMNPFYVGDKHINKPEYVQRWMEFLGNKFEELYSITEYTEYNSK